MQKYGNKDEEGTCRLATALGSKPRPLPCRLQWWGIPGQPIRLPAPLPPHLCVSPARIKRRYHTDEIQRNNQSKHIMSHMWLANDALQVLACLFISFQGWVKRGLSQTEASCAADWWWSAAGEELWTFCMANIYCWATVTETEWFIQNFFKKN